MNLEGAGDAQDAPRQKKLADSRDTEDASADGCVRGLKDSRAQAEGFLALYFTSIFAFD